jgi:nicotinamidase-related amidase
MTDLKQTLIDVHDSVLIIVDIQDYFLKKLQPERVELLISRVGWLMEISKLLKVPMVVTAEDADRLDGFSRCLAEKLPPDTPVFNKMVFGLTGQVEILEAVHKTGRKTAVLVGLETDVCVAQSAIGLLQAGYAVVAVSDATDSPGEAHETGLQRMRNAGVLVTSLKDIYYEWIRTVELSNSLGQQLKGHIGTPKGIIL